MSRPADIPHDELATAAVDAILKPLGTALRHYMPLHKADAIRAMQDVLAAERDRCAQIADAHSECERDCGDTIAAAIRYTPPHHTGKD